MSTTISENQPPTSDEFTMQCGNFKLALGKRTYIMGILNLTPDSFYDGGKFVNPEAAIKHAEKMVEDGADIIDIGSESSRPGSNPISSEEEINRLKPVLPILCKGLNIPISVDTYKSTVAKWALDNGAAMINDISGFRFDHYMAKVTSEYNVLVVIMHTYGSQRQCRIIPTINPF